jgi:hypothetical protein
MYLNDFSVQVPEGRERPGGYVELRNGDTYTLRLRNNHDVSCDARVSVDGNEIGIFRIYSHGSIRLERPVHDDGQLTFYTANSKEGRQIGLDEDNPSLGLISVEFTPARKKPKKTVYTSSGFPYGSSISYNWDFSDLQGSLSDSDEGVSEQSLTSDPPAMAMAGMPATRSANYESGGTGLSGKSNQRFVNVGELDYDYSLQTTINLRLVAKSNDGPRPLMSNANPVPPPV